MALSIYSFPALNAFLNAFAALLLFLGWLAIRRGAKTLHKNLMIGALAASGLFLTCYLTYHLNVPGITRYQGQGFWRVCYFFILSTHTPLAVVIVPLCVYTVGFALNGNFKKHVRIARWLLPVWLYVSVTGVLIYLMLYPPHVSVGG